MCEVMSSNPSPTKKKKKHINKAVFLYTNDIERAEETIINHCIIAKLCIMQEMTRIWRPKVKSGKCPVGDYRTRGR
jgi:hypothetical protein